MPQVIENYKTKNPQNVSFSMIFCWFLGDSYRLFYNIKNKAPIQLVTSVLIQVTMDLIVCIQIVFYGKKKSRLNIKPNQMNDIIKSRDDLNLPKINRVKNINEIIEVSINKDNNFEKEKKDINLDNNNSSDPDRSLK